MVELSLTEKQQEVIWLRYGRRKSIDEIAGSTGISRRAVLMRLRNARKRLKLRGHDVNAVEDLLQRRPRQRLFAASQISGTGAGGRLQLDDC